MPTIIFESSDGKREISLTAPNGGPIADLCDDSEAPIPFSCRSASCATCHIEVLEGAEGFLEPEDEELDVLEALQTLPPRYRLACCARLKPGNTVIRVRAQNEY